MAINKKIIHFKNKKNFDNEVANGNILDTSIVFIQDTQEIYTHGTFYDGSTINLKTINGESILGEGDLIVESGAKVYTWNWDGESETVTLSQEEYDNIVEADIVVLNIGGIYHTSVDIIGKEISEELGVLGLIGRVNLQGTGEAIINISIEISTKLATFTIEVVPIPTKTSELENDSNFVSSDDLTGYATETYVNESVSSKQGIIDDLDTIRSGAALGATALQSYTEQYKGTITGVKMNGTTKNPSSGVVDLGTVITEHQDLSGYQPKLVSGTNIKTINGKSLLGEGNIQIEGGGGSVEIPIIEHEENDTTITIESNTYHKWGEVSELTISLGEPANLGVVNEYMFSFVNTSLTPRLTIDELMWEHGEYPYFAFFAKNVVKIMDGHAKMESYSLAQVLLMDSYLSNSEEKTIAQRFTNVMFSINYNPGDYPINNDAIYVSYYHEYNSTLIEDVVTTVRIPVDGQEYTRMLLTSEGYQFVLFNDGTIGLYEI